jgi:acetyl-CoA carboxylase biotin carboxyl carrier protein
MDVQQVRELAELMAEHGLTEIKLRDGEKLIALRKGPLGEPVILAAPAPAGTAPTPPAAVAHSTTTPPSTPQDDGLVAIRSPMVGTFYSAHDPESPPFVMIGSQIDPTTTVCIIEAMKVFNEIKAEVSGTVERILVSNEQPVEYGQPLMMVRPR